MAGNLLDYCVVTRPYLIIWNLSDEHAMNYKLSFHRNFVHDPKMANEPTVSASVKLQYTGRNGDRYIVSRCMEAKQMAKNVSGT